jgi:hypothetical protein
VIVGSRAYKAVNKYSNLLAFGIKWQLLGVGIVLSKTKLATKRLIYA